MVQTENKIYSLEEFLKVREQLKKENKKLVFSNGCFDIVHLGHLDYLQKARNLGDYLVLGLNSDKSVIRLKGSSRPVINQESRLRLMASLEFVDAVILFNEDTPQELIHAILPDILVKGNDYTPDNIVGADIVKANGGDVKTIELVEGYSTSAIIDKIKN